MQKYKASTTGRVSVALKCFLLNEHITTPSLKYIIKRTEACLTIKLKLPN
ncbi:hypothetical protein LguiA_030449 [Lonicera macranthoides]